MKIIFADALYWIALINPKDQWHVRVQEAARTLGQARLVTTEGVLTEVLNFYAEGGLPGVPTPLRVFARF